MLWSDVLAAPSRSSLSTSPTAAFATETSKFGLIQQSFRLCLHLTIPSSTSAMVSLGVGAFRLSQRISPGDSFASFATNSTSTRLKILWTFQTTPASCFASPLTPHLHRASPWNPSTIPANLFVIVRFVLGSMGTMTTSFFAQTARGRLSPSR